MLEEFSSRKKARSAASGAKGSEECQLLHRRPPALNDDEHLVLELDAGGGVPTAWLGIFLDRLVARSV